jgi:hypothetical protein
MFTIGGIRSGNSGQLTNAIGQSVRFPADSFVYRNIAPALS